MGFVQVKATSVGYHEGYREIGDVFSVPDDFPPSPWWVRVGGPDGADGHEPEMTPESGKRKPGRKPAAPQTEITSHPSQGGADYDPFEEDFKGLAHVATDDN